MRVFITGGTGFLGSYAVGAFLDGGHDVCVLARPETDPWRIRERLPAVTVIPGTLDEPLAFVHKLADFRPDTILNLAWSGVSNSAHDDPSQPTNLEHVRRLLELTAETTIKHWIGLGSQAEYGPCDHPIAENQPISPVTGYGRTKSAACTMAAQFCADHGIRFAWLRLFSCYGPKDKETWLIPSLIIKLLAGTEPALTDGRQRWDYLYVEDAAKALLAVASNAEVAGIFNLGSGKAVPVRQICEHVRNLIDPSRSLGFGKIAPPANPVMLLEADIARLSAASGWKPSTSLNDGLAKTVQWFRDRSASETV